ncbi:MAG: hypothetical protein EPN72_09140 [Nevskiaceae bacterium]|nr:MAG: hypothetical protein EPN63_08480 [Nevskiaceae bacterium]TBR72603.1 MAG: hypothetical protein EPN72_09140 [Nevskiaceae bacterium]
MSLEDEIKPLRRLLIGHGALLMLAAGVIGLAFTFFVLGHVVLWPIPGQIEYQLPGTYHDWHMAHMEALINGAVVFLVAALLPALPFAERGLKRVAYAVAVVAWVNVIASTIKIFFKDSQGLEASALLSNNIVFALFYVGVVVFLVLMATIAWKCLRSTAP